MAKLFSRLSAIIFALVLIAGAGVYWLSERDIAKAQNSETTALAKSAALTISAHIELLNQSLDKMSQDPEVLTAMIVGNPAMLETIAAKLQRHMPNVLKIRLLLPNVSVPDAANAANLGFADLDLVNETLTKNRSPSIQGDKADRHLAIARKITQNGQTLGIIFASLGYDFITKSLAAAASDHIYMELLQANTVLASIGTKSPVALDADQTPQINVANTDWAISFQQADTGFRLSTGIILFVTVPALLALLACFTFYRQLSGIFSEDLHLLLKAFKDMMTNSIQVGSYPFKLNEMGALFSNLMQFKRVLEHEERGNQPVMTQKDNTDNDMDIMISDDEDFEFDMFFDDPSELKPR